MQVPSPDVEVRSQCEPNAAERLADVGDGCPIVAGESAGGIPQALVVLVSRDWLVRGTRRVLPTTLRLRRMSLELEGGSQAIKRSEHLVSMLRLDHPDRQLVGELTVAREARELARPVFRADKGGKVLKVTRVECPQSATAAAMSFEPKACTEDRVPAVVDVQSPSPRQACLLGALPAFFVDEAT